MKVTTELKNIIKSEFDKKRKELYTIAENKRIQEYNALCEEIKNSSEYQNLKEAAAQFINHFDYVAKSKNNGKKYYVKSFVETLADMSPDDFIGSCTYTGDIPEYSEGIDELARQQNALLVKLTYEKDLDGIKEILSEFGITL